MTREEEINKAFEHAMTQEDYYRACEYQASDHAEKAKMHRMRWYWMDKATEVLTR